MQSQQNAVFQTSQKIHYSRLFPELEPLWASDDQLWALAESMASGPALPGASRTISQGIAIMGQFHAHDLTFESSSKFKGVRDIRTFQNDRTINLDLDSVYGQHTQEFLYDAEDSDKLLLGKRYETEDGAWYDLQRNAQQKAIIPDPRNDENIIVSRIHALFIRFHNQMADYLRYQGIIDNTFQLARRQVVWHYHWIILHEYLHKLMDGEVYDRMLAEGCRFYTDPRMLPLEFSGAAFRIGHSMVPGISRINSYTEKGLFELGAFTTMEEYVDWRYLFNHGDGRCQFAQLIDTHIHPAFHDIPFIRSENERDRSLPFRNLKRGMVYGLPSGEDVAQRLGAEPVKVRETRRLGMDGTPLWYYILKEAEECGHGGEHLGPVGSTILGECFYTLMANDDYSFLKLHPGWCPSLGRYVGRFDMIDLIRFTEKGWGPTY